MRTMILSGEKIIQIILLFAFPTHYIIKQIQLSSVQFSRKFNTMSTLLKVIYSFSTIPVRFPEVFL